MKREVVKMYGKKLQVLERIEGPLDEEKLRELCLRAERYGDGAYVICRDREHRYTLIARDVDG